MRQGLVYGVRIVVRAAQRGGKRRSTGIGGGQRLAVLVGVAAQIVEPQRQGALQAWPLDAGCEAFAQGRQPAQRHFLRAIRCNLRRAVV